MSPVPSDPYDFANGGVADAEQVDARFALLYAALNAGLDETNLAAALKDTLGVSDAGTVRRGKSIIATEESRTNVAYGLLTTPDRVANVALPADGLLLIAYSALWKNSVASAGRAALFVGATQVSSPASEGAPVLLDTTGDSLTNWRRLSTVPYWAGLQSDSSGAASDASDIAGPITVGLGDGGGGFALVRAAAGTYDVSVQFKATSGSVSAKNRKLWVVALGF